MDEGMLLVKLFLERSRISRLLIYPIDFGMIPVIWLLERRRNFKFDMDSPILAGIEPKNLFLDRSSMRHPRFGRRIEPSKRLELKSINVKEILLN